MISRYKVKKSPLNEKRKKTFVSVVLVISIFSIAYGIYNFTKLKPVDGKKEEIKIETGDRPLPKKVSIFVNADKGGLSLRKERSATSERLAIIPDKTKLEASEELDGWYKVTYNGKEGWISKQFATVEVPQEDFAAKWSQYSNPLTGYKIKYPLGWKVQDYGENKYLKALSFVAFSNQDLPTAIPEGSEFIAPITVEISDQKLEDIQKDFDTISGVTKENINISSFSGVKYSYTSVSSNTLMTTVVGTINSKVYVFSEGGGYLEDLTNMLKTFIVGG